MQAQDAPRLAGGTAPSGRTVYDHEMFSRILNPADPLHAELLLNIQALERLEVRIGSPDWTDEDHAQLIRLCHKIRNQLCCLTLSHDLLVRDEGATPQRTATLAELCRMAAFIKQ